MTDLIEVNRGTCEKDGKCINDCPSRILVADTEGFPTLAEGGDAFCLDCGHCVAICPTSAIRHRNADPVQCESLESADELDPKLAATFLNSRRSIRQYRRKAVEKDLIERLIRMGDFAPSAKNVQPAKWMVIQDPADVNRLAGLVVDWMRTLMDKHPAVARSMRMDSIIESWEKGEDRVLRGAPHLVIGYAPAKEPTAQIAITNGIAYMELSAPSLGLGTCWAGYFTTASQTFEPLKAALHLPDEHAVFGAFMLGVPRIAYKRIPFRKPTDITWR